VLNAPAQVPLRFGDPDSGTAVAILGYPENGPLTFTPGRLGATSTVLTRDAYGDGPVERTITAVAGHVRHGNSGGPAVDRNGVVRTTIFAAGIDSPTGYGIPSSLVERALRARSQEPVSTGSCAG
jgi:S1-C subfamily serine protease